MAIIFKTEDERAEAISKISSDPGDAPVGVNIEEFMRQNEEKLDEIMSTEITPEGNPDIDKPIPNLEPDNEPETVPDTVIKPDPPSVDNNVNEEVERLQRRNQSLQEQRDQLMDDHANDIAKLQRQIEEIKKGTPTSANVPDETLPIDTEISNIQNEINQLEEFMNADEVDVFDEESVKKMRKLNMLSIKLTGLVSKRSHQIVERQQNEINDIKKTQKIERDNEQRKNNRKTMFSAIEKFREEVPELHGRKYEEMDAEYTGFGREIASLWFDTPLNKVTGEQIEIAVNKYTKQVPELMERVNAKGIKAPEGLTKYIILSDINALRMGYVLDKTTGEWKQMTDSSGKNVVFPSLKAAWNHYKEENHLPAALKVDRDNASIKSVMSAINKRADVVELDSAHKTNDIVEMSKEAAQNIVSKYSEEYISMIARKNFDDPLIAEYNKALKALDMAGIDREDFE